MRLSNHRSDGNRGSVWTTKSQAAAAVVADCGARDGDPVIDGHPAISFFGGRDEVLVYLHTRWVTYFGVVLDEELMARPESIIDAAWRAWWRLSDDQPSLARILSWYYAHPVIRRADERHRRLLAGVAVCDGKQLPDFASARLPAHARTLAESG